MKKLLLPLVMLPVLIFGQERTSGFKRWSSIGTAGLVAGQAGNRPVFQLSSGINYYKFFTGVGIGYDSYEFNTIPVFADCRFKFGKNEVGFLYGIAGYNFAAKNKEKVEPTKIGEDLSGGFYFDGGIGWRIPFGKYNRLSLSTGYSQKKLVQRKTYVYPCITGDCPEDNHKLYYNLGRLIAKLSWELGY